MPYFDNAATSHPKPPEVVEAMLRALADFGNPARGTHPFALAALRCVEQARVAAAELFNCRPERVAFAKNATEALNIAVASLDGHVVTTEAEHNSVLRPLHRRGGFDIAAVDAAGGYGVDDLAKRCRPDTRAVIVAHASNLTGNLVPIADIGRFCRERGLLLVVDAAQTAGLVDIDMEAMRIDALCFTGHKALYGPQGTGGICLGGRFAPRPVLVGGSGSHTFDLEQPSGLPEALEAGTLNAHGIAGLLAGLEYVRRHRPAALLRRADELARRFRRGLADIRGVTIYGDHSQPLRAPIVTLNLDGEDSAEVAAELADRHDIAVRAGFHCAPLLHRRFGTVGRGAVRFSFSHCNSEREIDDALEALRRLSASRG